MAERVNKEVARERLRRTCKAGIIVSVIVLLLGLCYAGMAACIGMGFYPTFQFLRSAMYLVVPTMDDMVLGATEAGTKALLLFLMGLFGILACSKISKGSEPFRLRQLKQLKFVALLTLLLGFLPTLVADLVKIGTSLQAGRPALAVLSYSVEPMCVLVGIVAFVAARILVAGGVYEQAEDVTPAFDGGASQVLPDVPDVSDIASRIPDIDRTLAGAAAMPARASEPLQTDVPVAQNGFDLDVAEGIEVSTEADETLLQSSQE